MNFNQVGRGTLFKLKLRAIRHILEMPKLFQDTRDIKNDVALGCNHFKLKVDFFDDNSNKTLSSTLLVLQIINLPAIYFQRISCPRVP